MSAQRGELFTRSDGALVFFGVGFGATERSVAHLLVNTDILFNLPGSLIHLGEGVVQHCARTASCAIKCRNNNVWG